MCYKACSENFALKNLIECPTGETSHKIFKKNYKPSYY